MAAPVQVNQGSTVAASTNPTAVFTSNTTAGNTCLLWVNCDNTVVTPSGWTLETSQVFNNGNYIYRRNGNGTTLSTVVDGGNQAMTWAMIEVVGGSGGAVAFKVGTGQSANGTTANSGTTTPTAGQPYLIIGGLCSSKAANPAPLFNTSVTAGFSQTGAPTDQATSRTTLTNVGTSIWMQDVVSASGAYGIAGTITAGGNAAWTAITIFLAQTAAGPDPIQWLQAAQRFPAFAPPFIDPGVIPFQIQGDRSTPTAVSLTDAGAGDDSTLAVAAAVPLADTAAADDAVTAAAAVALTDAATGDDSSFTITATAALTDAGAAADSLTIDFGSDSNQALQAAQPFPPFFPPIIDPLAVPFQLQGDRSAAASIALTDSGVGDDSAVTITAAVPLADTAVGADAVTVAAAIALTDSGAATDSLTLAVTVPLTDSAAGVDALTVAAAVPLADTGAGADSLTVDTGVDPNQAGPLFAPMFLQPSYGAFQLFGDASASPLIGLTDAGAGSDTLAVTATAALSDTGVGADALTVAAAVALSDSGAGADAVTVTVPVALTDAGAGADTLTATAAVPLTESGAAADAVTVTAAVPLTDAAVAADTVTTAATVPLTDSGAGVDSMTVLIDTGYTVSPYPFPPFAAPFISPRPVPFQLLGDASGTTQASLTDVGTGTDGITVTAIVALTDSGAGSDSFAVTAPLALADSGTATDSLTVTVTVSLADSGAAADTIVVPESGVVYRRYPITGVLQADPFDAHQASGQFTASLAPPQVTGTLETTA